MQYVLIILLSCREKGDFWLDQQAGNILAVFLSTQPLVSATRLKDNFKNHSVRDLLGSDLDDCSKA